MLRRGDEVGTGPTDTGAGQDDDRNTPRQWSARRTAALRRLAFVPLAALAAALAGAVFLVLLPICGIASIAEGIARLCWQTVRRGLSHGERGILSHH